MARQSSSTTNAELPKSKLNKESIKSVKKLLKYIRPYRYKFMVGMVFLFFSSVTLLAFPALFGAMIDAAQSKETYSWLPVNIHTIGYISFAILFFLAIVYFFWIRLFVEVSETSVADIRRDTSYLLSNLPNNLFTLRWVGGSNSSLSADMPHGQ